MTRSATASCLSNVPLAALYGGRSPWQMENVAGLIDADNETPEEVALREVHEESNLGRSVH